VDGGTDGRLLTRTLLVWQTRNLGFEGFSFSTEIRGRLNGPTWLTCTECDSTTRLAQLVSDSENLSGVFCVRGPGCQDAQPSPPAQRRDYWSVTPEERGFSV
jgi:hypothetical protein